MTTNKIYISDLELIEEWDFKKNSLMNLDPTKIAHKSNKRAWWIGKECKHSWDTIVSRRGGDNDGCPICSNRRLLKGFNDFETRYPEHAKDWSPENEITPDSFIVDSTTKYLWICRNIKSPHNYLMTPKHKIRGQSCGICDGKIILKGYNDFGSNFPELLPEWDYELNSISPYEITSYNFKAVHWICKEKHRWKVSLINRVNKKTGCPKCAKSGVSKQEKDFVTWLKEEISKIQDHVEILENNKTALGRRELDVYIPEYNLAFEYNGEYWHDREQYIEDTLESTSKSKEKQKEKDCKDLGITLVQVWSSDWIKDNVNEKQKIIDILKEAIKES